MAVTSYSGTLFEEDWPGKDAKKDTFLLKVFHSSPKQVLVLDPNLESAKPTPRTQVVAYIQDQKKDDDKDKIDIPIANKTWSYESL